jgi:hypothetical protein
LQATSYFDIDRRKIYVAWHCRKVKGGREIGVPAILKARLSKITQAATSSPQVFVEKWGYPFWDDYAPPVLKVLMIVDLLSRRTVLSWKPGPNDPTALHRYTLSSTGRYLAESGDGSFELDQLTP